MAQWPRLASRARVEEEAERNRIRQEPGQANMTAPGPSSIPYSQVTRSVSFIMTAMAKKLGAPILEGDAARCSQEQVVAAIKPKPK